MKQFENEREATKEEVENDTMASNGVILTQPERVPENMCALSAESLFLPENQSRSNNLHSQEAEIINPEENSSPKENLTANSNDPQLQVNNLSKPSEEKVFKPELITNNNEREATIREEVENDAVASKAFYLTKPERVPENTSALSMESLFLFSIFRTKLFLKHCQEADISTDERFKVLKKIYFYTAKSQQCLQNTTGPTQRVMVSLTANIYHPASDGNLVKMNICSSEETAIIFCLVEIIRGLIISHFRFLSPPYYFLNWLGAVLILLTEMVQAFSS
jgi:hypothetical protein